MLSRHKKVFNIESDNESETEVKETDSKIRHEIKTSLKNFNESDGEELIVTDDDEEAEAHCVEEANINTFFDDEAELSGSDVSSDEDEADDEAEEEEEAVEQEDLPSDSEIEDQKKRFFK